jgi:hypothetical protein
MALDRDTYDDTDWAASTGHAPLQGRPAGEAFLIYRHWIWANLQKLAFEDAMKLEKPFEPVEMVMVARSVSFMFVWYGMLWSVIEALEKRNIVLRAAFGHDVARVRRALKLCRNAIMHVPDGNEALDIRIQKLVEQHGLVVRIRRVHHGLGRLLREEVQRQSTLPAPLGSPAPEA